MTSWDARRTSNRMIALASLLGCSAVAIGAFGAHGLPRWLAELAPAEQQYRLQVLQTGATYHMSHALAMLGVGILQRVDGPSRRWSQLVLLQLLGVVLFSGSLYALALSGWKVLGAITPLGGVAFLASWLLLGWKATRGSTVEG